MAKLLEGADVVKKIESRVAKDIELLKSKRIHPTLAMIRVGENAGDISYEKTAANRFKNVGIGVKNIILPIDVTQAGLMKNIQDLNNDSGVHGVLLFRPLPEHLSLDAVRAVLIPEKDIDGITDSSLAGVFAGTGHGFPPCTAQACIEILDHYDVDCKGKRTVVVGRSLVVGKPVAIMLMGKHATVTVCHTRTVDLPDVVRNAEILIVAAGQTEGLTKEYFSPGQVVIDVGINWNEQKGKLCGDVLFEDAEPIVAAITPVPGGVGTVTTSVLASHVVKAALNLESAKEFVISDHYR